MYAVRQPFSNVSFPFSWGNGHEACCHEPNLHHTIYAGSSTTQARHCGTDSRGVVKVVHIALTLRARSTICGRYCCDCRHNISASCSGGLDSQGQTQRSAWGIIHVLQDCDLSSVLGKSSRDSVGFLARRYGMQSFAAYHAGLHKGLHAGSYFSGMLSGGHGVYSPPTTSRPYSTMIGLGDVFSCEIKPPLPFQSTSPEGNGCN